ncbi:MAG: prephenate dehydrogenase [Anaerolineae bacterium]|nr:MAG: prephenate dehydrogenase [Anaerolineae bacterium]
MKREAFVKITLAIIGLGQIGSSFGLALAEHRDKVRRIGFDADLPTGNQARKIGAVDEAAFLLRDAVKQADAVLLSIPLQKVEEALQDVAAHMRPGTVLMDTAPLKMQVARWAAEHLPEGCSYVGLTPVVGPKYLQVGERGVEAAHADLFQNSVIAISSPPGSGSQGIRLAADLIRLTGAEALFADQAEIDGLMTATHFAPQFLAAALLNATVDQPGWREARKLAGRAYAEVSGPIEHYGDPEELTLAARLNRENTLRVLGSMIASLQTLYNDIQSEDYQALSERLARARKGRDRWWHERQQADGAGKGRPDAGVSGVLRDFLRPGMRRRQSRNDERD